MDISNDHPTAEHTSEVVGDKAPKREASPLSCTAMKKAKTEEATDVSSDGENVDDAIERQIRNEEMRGNERIDSLDGVNGDSDSSVKPVSTKTGGTTPHDVDKTRFLRDSDNHTPWYLEWSQPSMKIMTIDGGDRVLTTEAWRREITFLRTIPRPFAEPPLFDYGWMVEKGGLIEKQEKLCKFAYIPDIELKTQRIDIVIEEELLQDYCHCMRGETRLLSKYPQYRSVSEDEAQRRRLFNEGLLANLEMDLNLVELELFDHEDKNEHKLLPGKTIGPGPDTRAMLKDYYGELTRQNAAFIRADTIRY